METDCSTTSFVLSGHSVNVSNTDVFQFIPELCIVWMFFDITTHSPEINLKKNELNDDLSVEDDFFYDQKTYRESPLSMVSLGTVPGLVRFSNSTK